MLVARSKPSNLFLSLAPQPANPDFGQCAVQAALEALRVLPFGPGEETVIVCNDWHTALLPVLLKVPPPFPPAPNSLPNGCCRLASPFIHGRCRK